ncbi:hypothetical protein [Gelidibacter sp.]|uniref:hypothetical protein n=1 Tax=Gelidibacter sp. TaxID=2018083 RepID=UPI00326759BF
MEIIKLKISKEFYDAFLEIIQKCNPEDVQIVDEGYHSTKVYLDEQLKDLDSESSDFLSIDELDMLLEKVLSKHAS